MKKFFAFATAVIFALSLNAKKVVLNFATADGITELGIALPDSAKGTDLSAASYTKDGVTFSCKKVNKNDTRVWNSKNDGNYELRTYANNTLTFKADDYISAIEFEGKNVLFAEIKVGKAWVGNTDSVTLTASGTCNITAITLTVGEPADVWVPDTVTVAGANALVAAEDKHDHYVKGVVMCQPFITYDTFKDKVSFWMNDVENPADTIEFYDGMGKDNKKWESLEAAWEELRVGDTIMVYAGALAKYTNKTTGISFNEITGGFYVEKLGANPNPPEIVYPTYDTISVAEAVEMGKKLEGGKTTSEVYVVAGYAGTAYDIKDGKQTWYMADEPDVYCEFQAYQCTPDSAVVKGDYMYVKGKIMKYVKDSKVTIEISNGTATHGVAPAPVVLEPITVAEAIEIAQALTPEQGTSEKTTEKYAVKGYVVSISQKYEDTYYMADEVGVKGYFQAFRCASVDRAVAEGDLVIVTGYIMNYNGGEYNNYEISGGTLVHVSGEGIENVQLTEKAQKIMIDGAMYILRNGKMYDVRGAQVR